MNDILLCILFTVLSYLLGSIPSAVWVGKLMYNIDVREHGSGNAGATNTFRVLGPKAGTIVFTLDVLKGCYAAYFANYFIDPIETPYRFVNLQLLFGFTAVLGHLFPVFAGFKGGKGIATLFGMILCIHYAAGLACLAVFLTVLFSTRYVSLGSMLAALSFPLFAIFVFKYEEPLFIAFGVTAALLVILTHRKNINKLVKGTENKANLFRKHRA